MPLHDKLQTIFKDAFGIETLADEMSIDTVDGWDSMGHVALASTLEAIFSVSFDVDELMEMEDIRKIVKIVGAKLEG